MKGRIAGVDFGTVRMGVALSDPTQFLASPLTTLSVKKDLKLTVAELLSQLALHAPIEAIVLGLPLHMDGKESPLSTQVRLFKALLETMTTLPIILWDERLSTAQSEKMLKELDFSRKKRAGRIDTITAAAILQNYLNYQLAGIL